MLRKVTQETGPWKLQCRVYPPGQLTPWTPTGPSAGLQSCTHSDKKVGFHRITQTCRHS